MTRANDRGRAASAAVALGFAGALAGCGGSGGGTSYATVPAGAPGAAAPAVAPAFGDDGLVAIDAAPVGGVQGPAVTGSSAAPRPGTPPPSSTSGAARPAPLQQLEDDPTRLEPLPALAAVETTASGLEIAYTTGAQREAIEPAWIESQWRHVQACTGVAAPLPAVLQIVVGQALPLTPTDDVVRAIDGAALATASVTAAGTTLQASEAGLLPGVPERGFALRAILGRWLWQSAALPERDYPFACAVDGPSGGV